MDSQTCLKQGPNYAICHDFKEKVFLGGYGRTEESLRKLIAHVIIFFVSSEKSATELNEVR